VFNSISHDIILDLKGECNLTSYLSRLVYAASRLRRL